MSLYFDLQNIELTSWADVLLGTLIICLAVSPQDHLFLHMQVSGYQRYCWSWACVEQAVGLTCTSARWED